MALDQLKEENSDMFIDERDYKRMEARQKKESLTGLCKRCRSLRFQHKPLDEDQNYGDAGTLLAPHVNNFDRKKLLKAMLPKIYSRSIIIYVCDAANFEASIVPEVFEKIEREHHKVILVANKIDALPKGFKVDSL